MNWKNSLDKYLTQPTDDGFDDWCDDVLGNKISDTFYYDNEKWINEYGGQCNKWLNKLFRSGKDTTEAAQIIERVFRIYRPSVCLLIDTTCGYRTWNGKCNCEDDKCRQKHTLKL